MSDTIWPNPGEISEFEKHIMTAIRDLEKYEDSVDYVSSVVEHLYDISGRPLREKDAWKMFRISLAIKSYISKLERWWFTSAISELESANKILTQYVNV